MDTALKTALTAAVVTALILAAERFGERVVGLLSGLPLTTAPALLLIGHAHGLTSAADAAVGGIVGCALASLFALAYDGAARRFAPATTLVLAIAAMALAVTLLSQLALSLATAGAIACACAVGALLFIREPQAGERAVVRKAPRRLWPALAIGLVSAAVSAVATGMDASLAGIVAAMPTIGVAMVAACHVNRGRTAVPTYLRAYVVSSLAKAAFCAAFAISVIAQGVAMALLLACVLGGLVCAVSLAIGPRQGRRSAASVSMRPASLDVCC